MTIPEPWRSLAEFVFVMVLGAVYLYELHQHFYKRTLGTRTEANGYNTPTGIRILLKVFIENSRFIKKRLILHGFEMSIRFRNTPFETLSKAGNGILKRDADGDYYFETSIEVESSRAAAIVEAKWPSCHSIDLINVVVETSFGTIRGDEIGVAL
ncbi:MAG TPA: hypothetical protein VKX17_20970 [Planctomycetota bacterium]|nr:hypothetical protein [Planctomycetota bacterium]